MAVMSSFAADLRCPDDGHLMQANKEGPVPFAICRHCEGLWFTREAIENKKPAILPKRSNQSRRKAVPNDRACPQCAIKLRHESVDAITIDLCPKCGGVWLDHAEEYKAACRQSLNTRLHKHAPTLTGKPSKAAEAYDRLLDTIVMLHDILEPEPEDSLLRLRLRRKK